MSTKKSPIKKPKAQAPQSETPKPEAPATPAPTLENLFEELQSLKQLAGEHTNLITQLQETLASKRKPPASNGKVQILDKQTGISILIILILYGPVLLFVFGRRTWCRYLCPIGALLKVFGSGCVGKVRLVSDKCTGCGRCNHSCAMQVDVMGELVAHGEVRSLNCIRCLKCTDECPEGAISFSLGRREASLSTDATGRAKRVSLERRRLSSFDVTIAVLWIGMAVVFNLTGVNQDAPMEMKASMTAGLLLVIYGIVWISQKAWSKLRMNVSRKF